MKKVSVIMSTHKTDSEQLDVSINSILNQTYKNIEFIIVFDGDREEYNRVNKKYGNKLKTILNEKNMGLPTSLNIAIKNASGEYIARMDGDDISIKDRIAKQVEYLNEHKDVYVCGTSAQLFGNINKKKTIYLKSAEEIKIQMLYKATLIHPTVMVRREIFDEYKYNEEFKCSQDFELWSRISDKYQIAFLPFIGLNYRVHSKQASIEKREEQSKLSKKVIKSNTNKITGKYNEKIYSTLCVLGGREPLSKYNYKEISDNIDYIIEKNTSYDKKTLKKVLYNRYFELIIKNKIIPLQIFAFAKCFKIYNLIEIISMINRR